MLRNLPIHRLYAIEERWQTLADAESSMRVLDQRRSILGGSDGA
jgi:hypothetical protein